jgi:hypothetical protein
MAITTALDIDECYQAGIVWGTVGAANEAKPVFLTID